ncbi:MAG: 50S ribosomal protein L29 [Kiritimatiellaeota bacterium]|jgi:large subunit ribosomal protein L29|nr:50S ribosomal protein L29 [Kiritimatiellota bacterium]
MKIKEIRENTNEELLAKIREAEKEILSIRVRKTGADGTSASPIKVRNLRKLVARAKTVITERERVKS